MPPEKSALVVLDGFTLNPGDLSWDRLEQLADCAIHDRTAPEQVVARAHGAQLVLTNKTVLAAETLKALKHLKYVGVLATGYNVVDIDVATELGIVVCNVPTYGTRSVAQMVLAHVLNFTQHAQGHAAAVRDGRWSQSQDWCFWDHPLLELDGMTMGIVGLGRIGQATARLAHAFGMNVLACSRTNVASPDFVELTDLETVLGGSDFVSLHCPLTAETERLMNAARLGWMKETAYLINTSRGGLIDEEALADALNAGRLAGAGLDVLAVEPPPRDHPLIRARNCQITPHIAWATHASRQRLLDTAIDNVAAFLAGKPQNVVS